MALLKRYRGAVKHGRKTGPTSRAKRKNKGEKYRQNCALSRARRVHADTPTIPDSFGGSGVTLQGLPLENGESRTAPDEPELEKTDETGKVVAYRGRFFLPQGSELTAMTNHRVVQGDRLDLLAYKYYGDPLQYWRICDANNAMVPDDLLKVGAWLKIPLPEAVPEAS